MSNSAPTSDWNRPGRQMTIDGREGRGQVNGRASRGYSYCSCSATMCGWCKIRANTLWPAHGGGAVIRERLPLVSLNTTTGAEAGAEVGVEVEVTPATRTPEARCKLPSARMHLSPTKVFFTSAALTHSLPIASLDSLVRLLFSSRSKRAQATLPLGYRGCRKRHTIKRSARLQENVKRVAYIAGNNYHYYCYITLARVS